MTKLINIIFIGLLFLLVPQSIYAKAVACAGISKKCTKDITFDKTIDGKAYSCYECKQALCQSGNLAGSQTSSVCELKTSTSNSQLILKHKPTVRTTNTNAHFDEADSMFTRRTEARVSQEAKRKGTIYRPSKRPKSIDHRSTSNTKKTNSWENRFGGSKRPTNIDHRNSNNKSNSGRKNEVVKARRGSIQAPTQVTLSSIKSDSLTLNWFDNAKVEYGVSVERGIPTHSSRGVNYHWVRIFNVKERIDSQVKGTGWRSDSDDNLKSNTQYCYRLKTYYKKNQNSNYQYSKYSYPVCVYTPLSR